MSVSESYSVGPAHPVAGDLERAQYEVLDLAIKIFGCDLSVLFPMDPLTGEFEWPPRWRGHLRGDPSVFQKPRSDGLARHALKERVLKVANVSEEPECASDFTRQESIQSFIAIEIDLPKRPKPLAVVYIDFRTPQQFGEQADREIGQFVGRATALLRRAWRYEKVLILGDQINQQLDDPHTLVRLLDDRIRDIIDSGNRFCLAVFDPVADTVTKLVSTAHGHIREEQLPLTEDDREVSAAGSLVRLPPRDGHRAEILVPMIFRNVPLGFLSIEESDDPFENEDLRIIELLRNHVATALNGMRLFSDLDTISHVAKQLHDEMSSVDAFRAYVEDVRRGADADVVMLYRWAPSEERFILPPFVAGSLFEPDRLPQRPDPLLISVVEYPDGIFCEDASKLLEELGLKRGREAFQTREKIESVAAIPLRVGGTIGVLFINYRKPQQFGGPRKRLIRILAAFAATALQSAHRFFEREGQYSQEMEIVRRVDAELNRTTRLDDVLQTTLELATGYVGAEEASILLADAKRKHLKLLVGIGPSSKKLAAEGWEHPIGGSKSIVRWVFERGDPALIHDLRNDETWKDIYVGGKNIRSELDVPLIDGERVIGVLNFESPRKNAFTDRHKEFIRNISGQVVLAIKRGQDYEARAAELDLFWAFARDTVGHLETKQLLRTTLAKTVATVGATTGALLRYDETGHFSVASHYGYINASEHATRVGMNGLIGAAIKELFHGDPSSLVTDSERWLVKDAATVIVAPISRGPKLSGSILLTSDSPTGFSDSTRRITEAISGMIAIAIENAEEFEKSEKDRKALHSLSAQVLQVSGDPTAVIRSVVTHALTLTNSTRSDLDVYENNRPKKTYFCDMGNRPSLVQEKSLDPMPAGVVRGIMAHVATTGTAYYTKGDAQKDPHYKPGIPGIHSELAVPLLTRSRDLLGVLNVESRSVDAFDERSKNLLELFGDAAVLAFEIARSREIVNVAVRLAEMTPSDVNEACTLIAETAAAHCGTLAVVRLYDHRTKDLILKHRAGAGEPPFQRIKATDGLTGVAMKTGESQCIDDLLSPPRDTPTIVPSDRATRSLLIAPVTFQGEWYGSVGLSHWRPRHFGEMEQNFVFGLARLLGATLQRFASMRREMKEKRTVILSATARDALDLQHDLARMNFVSSLTTLAERALDQNDFAKARSEYAQVNVEVAKAVELIRTVRERMASVPAPVKLSVADAIEKTLKDVLVPSGVNIVRQVPEPSPFVYADLFDVTRILNHLVANAVEYMPNGGTLTFSVRDDGSNVEIDIADTGPGIDESFLQDFETATNPKPGHTGWGLRSALRRAEFNDGTLFVPQTSEKGTTFTLRLPRASPEDWEATHENERTPSHRVV